MCLEYLVFGVFVIVTLMLNVSSTHDLQTYVGLSQVIHCSGHVQVIEPIRGANKQNQPKDVKHLNMLWMSVTKYVICMFQCKATEQPQS